MRGAHTRHHLSRAGHTAGEYNGRYCSGAVWYSRRPEFDQKQFRVSPIVLCASDSHERVLVQPRKFNLFTQHWARPPGTHKRRRSLFQLCLEQVPRWQQFLRSERLEDTAIMPLFEITCKTNFYLSTFEKVFGHHQHLRSAASHLAIVGQDVWR